MFVLKERRNGMKGVILEGKKDPIMHATCKKKTPREPTPETKQCLFNK